MSCVTARPVSCRVLETSLTAVGLVCLARTRTEQYDCRVVFFSGSSEPPAGVGAVGLHQPAAKERHRGHRKRHWGQQDLTAAGRGQVSFPELEGTFHQRVGKCACPIIPRWFLNSLSVVLAAAAAAQYLIPFILNQSGSLVYYYTLSTTGKASTSLLSCVHRPFPSLWLWSSRSVPGCPCGKLAHLPLHTAHWEDAGRRVWRLP